MNVITPAFSTLIRSKFDDALDYFQDGSIDLLHVDGRHLLEDVNHEFATWKRKLSPSAVVLFHDTNVREKNFGVWAAWRGLCESFRTFEFVHGNGLGVLVVDEKSGPEALTSLVNSTFDETLLNTPRVQSSRCSCFGPVQGGRPCKEIGVALRNSFETRLQRWSKLDEHSVELNTIIRRVEVPAGTEPPAPGGQHEGTRYRFAVTFCATTCLGS